MVEPFLGSGAVFLNTPFDDYLLCDSNPDLINIFNLLKRDTKAFIEECKALFVSGNNCADGYLRIRSLFNKTSDPQERARLFVYLNRHCFNGLCRYNKSGGFNAPFGRYDRPYFPEKEMRVFSERAQWATFRCQSFEQSFAEARPGDVIYCDPPYLPLTDTACFTAYDKGSFGIESHERLAWLAKKAASKGITTVISNHDSETARHIYTGASATESFGVRRSISCKGSRRTVAPEMLVVFN